MEKNTYYFFNKKFEKFRFREDVCSAIIVILTATSPDSVAGTAKAVEISATIECVCDLIGLW